MAEKNWKRGTRDAAYKAAEDYYKFLQGGGNPKEYRQLPSDSAEAVDVLVDQVLPIVRDTYKEDEWSPSLLTELEGYSADKMKNWLFAGGESPRIAAHKKQFADFQKLVVPEEEGQLGPWYGMDKDELDKAMRLVGYNPQDKKQRSEFFDKLSEHDINYNRARIVNEEMASPGGFASMMVAPLATEEAVRQSITGDFDDDKMGQAVAIDAVGTPLMAASIPFAGGSAVGAALTAGGVEAGKQVAAHQIYGRDVDPWAIVGSGTTAGTVPGAAELLSRYFAKAGSMEAKPFARGFARGVRGGSDPYKAERDNLKNLVITARKVSEEYNRPLDEAIVNRSRMPRPTSKGYNEGAMATAKKYSAAEKALKTLGFEHDMSPAALSPEYGQTPVIEKLIGAPPKFRPGSITQTPMLDEGEAVRLVLGRYDEPSMYSGVSETGSALPEFNTLLLNEEAQKQMLGQFPQKVSREIAKQTQGRIPFYDLGMVTGDILGRGFGQVEPIARMNPISSKEFSTKKADFKNTEWYKKMEKNDLEKAKAVERALIGL